MTVRAVAISFEKQVLNKGITYGIDKRGRTINPISWGMSMVSYDEFMSQF